MTEYTEARVRKLAEVAQLALSEEETRELTDELKLLAAAVAPLAARSKGEGGRETDAPVPLREDIPGETLSREAVLSLSEGRIGERMLVPLTVEESV